MQIHGQSQLKLISDIKSFLVSDGTKVSENNWKDPVFNVN